MNSPTTAMLGNVASFHEQATNLFFPNGVSKLYCTSFAESCKSLSISNADFLVIAVENSIAGPLFENHQLIEDYGFSMVDELELSINLHLMGLPSLSLDNMLQIQSHPVALAQCSNFIKSISHVEVVEAKDTSEAASEIARKRLAFTGALASPLAAEQFGLNIIAENVQNEKDSFTRFLLLERFNGLPSSKPELFKISKTVLI